MEVTLNKNGWHRKLQKFVFKDAPLYNSLCPYFWFTVFCFIFTFLIPIVPFIKLIKGIFIGAGMLLRWTNRNVCIPIMDGIIARMDDMEVIKSWAVYDEYHNYHSDLTTEEWKELSFWKHDVARVQDTSWKTRDKQVERFRKWQALNPDWKEKIDAIKAKRKTEYEAKLEAARLDKEAAAKRAHDKQMAKWKAEKEKMDRENKMAMRAAELKVRRQKMFTKIAVYTKWIAYLIVGALVGLIVWGIVKLFSWLYNSINVNWAVVGNITLNVLGIILGAAIVIAAMYFLIKLIQKCELKPSDSKTLRAIAVPFVWIWKGLVWIAMNIIVPISLFTYKWILMPVGGVGVGIGLGLKFIVMYLKSTKDGYCPAINWKEEEEKK